MANNYYKYINNGSIITVDTSSLLSDVQQEYISVFGENLSLDPSTPQGRLIEIEANSRKELLNINAMVANQINIDYATGQGLDALGSLFGRQRKIAISTAVLCYLSGTPNTVIPANSQAKTSAGDIFYTPNNITLDDSGNATSYFYSLVAGDIPCEINTLTEIVTQVVGWESINNPTAAIIGSNQESDNNFKSRIKKSRYNGVGLLGDVKSALSSLDDVISFFIYNNGEKESVTIIDNLIVDEHSILVIVQGGSDTEIAQALFEKVSAGCGYTELSGQSVTINVPDKIGNVVVQYPIKFNRPQNIEFECKVTVSRNNYTGSDLEGDIITAILSWANNENSEVDGLIIGTDIYTYEIGSAISNQIPEIIIKNVQIALVGGTLSNNPIEIKINEIGVITQDNITVEIVD
jgi:uncharacterized phage protein gp47/JayE